MSIEGRETMLDATRQQPRPQKQSPVAKKQPKRVEALLRGIELTSGDRNKDYGDPTENFQITVDIFESMTGIKLTAQQGMLFQVAVKLARLRQTPNHEDSHIDAAVYLAMSLEAASK